MICAVTGGAGFIGSNLSEALLKKGHKVRVIDNFFTGRRENIAPFISDITLYEGDIRNTELISKALNGVDVVFHEAAFVSVPGSVEHPVFSNDININGTLNVLDCAVKAGVKRVVFAASAAAYGDIPELPNYEGMVTKPLSPYAVQKIAGENYLKIYASLYNIETVSLRYFNVFGNRQNPKSQYAAAIPKFISGIRDGISPTIFGDGTQTRDFIYVDNVVEANILAATVDGISGMLFNCACGEQIVLNDVIKLINEYFGKDIESIYVPANAGDIKHSYASIELIKQKMGFVPKISFKEGLYKTIESFAQASPGLK